MKATRNQELKSDKGISASRALSSFLTFFLILFGAVALALLFVIIRIELREQNRLDSEQKVALFGNELESFLNDRIRILQDYARFPVIILAAQQSEESDDSIVNFMNKLSMLGERNKITLLDKSGRVVHETENLPDFHYEKASWVKPLLQAETDPVTSISYSGSEPYWRMVVPVVLKGKIEGLLIAEVPFDVMNKTHFRALLGPNEQLQFIRGNIPVYGIGEPNNATPYNLFLKQQNVMLEYRANHNPFAVMQNNLLISIAIILLVIALITIRLSIRLGRQSFVRPLEHLRIMAATLAHGQRVFAHQNVSHIKEIQLLFNDFTSMAETIRNREEELTAAQEHLEARIAARTHDLNESHKRIASILGTIQSGIMVIDLDANKIIEVNEAFVHMIGMPREQILGQSCQLFSNDPDDEVSHCSTLRETCPRNEESTMHAANGESITVLKSAVPISYNDRTHLLVSFVDISDRKKGEKALEEARRSEIRLAAHIQEKLLIGMPPRKFGNAQISAVNIPSQTVSGDFYDFHEWHESAQCLDIIIGDVMGKGINAALLGAGVKTAWHQALVASLEQGWWAGVPPTDAIVQRLHQLIVPELLAFESFITLCYARINLEDQLLEYVHCGHTEIILWKAEERTCLLLDGTSPPLGMLETEQYETRTAPLKPGDCVLFFSDGITETENIAGELFGIDRLCSIVKRASMGSPQDIIDAIQHEVALFGNSIDNADDLSCIVIKALPVSSQPGQNKGIGPWKKLSAPFLNTSGDPLNQVPAHPFKVDGRS